MTAEKTTMAFGWRVYGLGVMALGMVCPAWGDFDLGQPVPKDFPDRTALAYAAAAFMLVAGTAVEWRRTAAWGAAALAARPSSRCNRRSAQRNPLGSTAHPHRAGRVQQTLAQAHFRICPRADVIGVNVRQQLDSM